MELLIFMLVLGKCVAHEWTSPMTPTMWTLNGHTMIQVTRGSNKIYLACTEKYKHGNEPKVQIKDSWKDKDDWLTSRYNNSFNDSFITRYTHLVVPEDRHSLFLINDRKFSCQVDTVVKHLTLQVAFLPFIDKSVSSIQSVALVECPIRTPNFQQFVYRPVVLWSVQTGGREIMLTDGLTSKTKNYLYVEDKHEGSLFTCWLETGGGKLTGQVYYEGPSNRYIDFKSVWIGSLCSTILFVIYKLLDIQYDLINLTKSKLIEFYWIMVAKWKLMKKRLSEIFSFFHSTKIIITPK